MFHTLIWVLFSTYVSDGILTRNIIIFFMCIFIVILFPPDLFYSWLECFDTYG